MLPPFFIQRRVKTFRLYSPRVPPLPRRFCWPRPRRAPKFSAYGGFFLLFRISCFFWFRQVVCCGASFFWPLSRSLRFSGFPVLSRPPALPGSKTAIPLKHLWYALCVKSRASPLPRRVPTKNCACDCVFPSLKKAAEASALPILLFFFE